MSDGNSRSRDQALGSSSQPITISGSSSTRSLSSGSVTICGPEPCLANPLSVTISDCATSLTSGSLTRCEVKHCISESDVSSETPTTSPCGSIPMCEAKRRFSTPPHSGNTQFPERSYGESPSPGSVSNVISDSSTSPSSASPSCKQKRVSTILAAATSQQSLGGEYFLANVEPHLSDIIGTGSVVEAAELVSSTECHRRYLLIVAHGSCPNGCENHSVIGIHYNPADESVALGLILPVFVDLQIKLRGDGEFQVSGGNQLATGSYWFKSCTVNGFWKIVGKIFQLLETGAEGDCDLWPSLEHYRQRLTQDGILLNEWAATAETMSDTRKPSESRDPIGIQIKPILSRIMRGYEFDELENLSSRVLREQCEKEIGQSLRHIREYIDGLILEYMGRGDRASKIFDFLYLGSEWNASDFDFLKENNVKQVLNVAGEIENFFSGSLTYYNIRVKDVPGTDLLRYFDDTYQFLKEAQMAGHAVFVHCKMGVSRSASVVIAFAMKEYQWSFQQALSYVRQHRSVVQPNKGFMMQLIEYEGILAARNNKVWGAQASPHGQEGRRHVSRFHF